MNGLWSDGYNHRKNQFLAAIHSDKTKYKRVALSPIRYAGGKSLAVGHIVEHLPPIKRLISPFFGGGSVEFAVAQKLGVEVIGADIYQPLANYWHYQLNYPVKLYRELLKLKPTKADYNSIRLLLKEWQQGQRQLSKLALATYFYYNHNLSYGPSFIGWASKVYLDEKRYLKQIARLRDFKANVTVKHATFAQLFKQYPDDFFYCDPPYFLRAQDQSSKMFAGVYPERNNPVHHTAFDHELLRDCLLKHQGGFILSYNDCYKSREYYKQYKQVFPSWQYTMGQGETRISAVLGNRNLAKHQAHVKQSHELLAISV